MYYNKIFSQPNLENHILLCDEMRLETSKKLERVMPLEIRFINSSTILIVQVLLEVIYISVNHKDNIYLLEDIFS